MESGYKGKGDRREGKGRGQGKTREQSGLVGEKGGRGQEG